MVTPREHTYVGCDGSSRERCRSGLTVHDPRLVLGELEPEFIAFVALIRRDGTSKPWPPEASTPRYRNTYLELDGWEYWTMGSPIPATTVINAKLARPPRCAGRLNDRSPIGEPPA